MRRRGHTDTGAIGANCRPLSPRTGPTVRVLAIQGDLAWVVPERDAGCSACTAAALCGASPVATDDARADAVSAGRFSLPTANAEPPLVPGDRLVVGLPEDGLAEATITAYAVPIFAVIAAGGLAEAWGAGDLAVLAAMGCGLALGLALARTLSDHRGTAARIAPRLIGRAEETPVPPLPEAGR